MKHYVGFTHLIAAIISCDDIDLNDKTVSFCDTDVVINGFAKIYSDIADMSACDRIKIIDKHYFKITRMIRAITTELKRVTGYENPDKDNMRIPDNYTSIIYDLLNMGIAPTPDLFNIVRHTGFGCWTEKCDSAGEKAIEIITYNCDKYNDVINVDFFEEYVAIENMDFGEQINRILNTKLPTNMYEWLTQYQWSDDDCEYVKIHFDNFMVMYETEVSKNDEK